MCVCVCVCVVVWWVGCSFSLLETNLPFLRTWFEVQHCINCHNAKGCLQDMPTWIPLQCMVQNGTPLASTCRIRNMLWNDRRDSTSSILVDLGTLGGFTGHATHMQSKQYKIATLGGFTGHATHGQNNIKYDFQFLKNN